MAFLKIYLVLLAAVIIFQDFDALAFTVVIDPGHGGTDHGATQGSIIESKIALEVALKLASKFQNDKDTKVILTRKQDKSVSLKQRVDIAAGTKADLFISLHGNSSVDRRAKGAEFYFGKSARSKTGASTSKSIDSIVQDLQYSARLYQSQSFALGAYNQWKSSAISEPRAIKQAPFFVINKNDTPSILVEFGFVTNTKESLELLKDETQDSIAQNLYAATAEYRQSKNTASTPKNSVTNLPKY